MGMAAPLDFYTADMVRELNERSPWNGPRYETVHGELLVSPAPRMAHQEVVGDIYYALRLYLDREPASRAFMSPADVSWGLPDVLTQPDVFVIPTEETESGDWKRIRHLLLAIEVLSPSSVRADRFTKRQLYVAQGTPAYWVVDADARMVEVWMPGDHLPHVERERLAWQPRGASTPFALSLADLFGPH
ncbi:MAG TPA: Uma2 family endonuclease [Gemmatimonadaceae bacterium]|nr:Uma2 family endonuclease [Gemmatimonadaceae bacterium]